MLQKETQRLEQREQQRESATRTAAELQAGIEGQREHCQQVALDIRDLAKKMGAKYELELERAVSAARRHCSDVQELVAENATGGEASQPAAQPRAQGLKVQAGAALSSFDAQCWPLCFTEFFHGDCAPNLERPSPLTFRQVFSYLMLREKRVLAGS